MQGTTSNDYVRKLDELDRLLNDSGAPMQPALIWRLLEEVAKWEHDSRASAVVGQSAKAGQRKVASNAATAALPPSTTPASTRELTRGGVI